ncbi:hypothetical protein ACIA5C_19965 [Actinoplanes sp. NPDC051343]|uniref:hypothetical protein n=1 Tax=Actinoplanes sp. NPDC051343 TaxID=3363906 RepID=UPI00378B83EE
MDQQDPFDGLEDWARKTEKRVRRERWQRRGFWMLAVVVAALVVVAVVPGLRSAVAGNREASGAYPTESVPSGISVTTTAKAVPTDPFAGSPAAHYPKGAAGITMPAATKVAGFSAAQVGAALKDVRAAMIAGRLDPQMLVGHKPDKFLGLLAPNSRKVIKGWFSGQDLSTVATWIDPAVRLDPAEPPRVSGRTTYRSLSVGGIRTLRITTNYVWVYAFEGPEHPLAAEHDQIDWDFPDTRNLRTGDRGMWLINTRSYGALVDCTAAGKGLLAPTRMDSAPVAAPSNTEDPDNYLRADHSLDIGDDCGNPPS